VIIYVHEFLNSNGSLLFPYMATANLPIRVGMEIYQVGTTTDMHFICCSVSSEGGVEDIERFGYGFVTYGNNGTVSGLTHLMTVRPKTTFKGYTNRTKFVLEEVSIMNTGNKAAQWYLGIGANLVGASWTDANTNYSAFEYDTAATAPTPWTVLIDSGYTPAAAGNKNDVSATVISSKYPITLDAAGANRDEGQISLFAEDIGGSTSLYFALKWKEIR
jgi:hypothetical protein